MSPTHDTSKDEKSCVSTFKVSLDDPEKAFFQKENPAPTKQRTKAEAGIMKKTPQASKISPSIPKIPAPRRNTTPLHVAGALVHTNLEISSRRKRHFLKSKNAITSQQAQAFPSSTAATKEFQVMGNEQKGIEVAPEDDFLDPFLCTPEHMVHVNVLGVAGIVIKRDVLITTGKKHLPANPEGMKLLFVLQREVAIR
jgi:hypothetical protein